jgi:hypothetical protein
MAIISRKYRFISIVTLGMISLLLICDRVNYHRFIFQVIDTSFNQSYIKRNIFICNKTSNESQISFKNSSYISIDNSINSSEVLNISLLKENSVEDLETEKSVQFLDEYNLIHEKVLQFESKSLVPIKRPSNSQLLYSDVVKDITVMTIGDKKCDNSFGNDLKVVIFVISRVDGFKRRSIIRKTWAQKIKQSIESKIYFAIGLTQDEKTQTGIESENSKYGDILQWNFIDNYYNLTIKSLGILRWITLNCFKTKFIYKVDDDCIVNYEKLIEFCDIANERTIYGHLWRKAFVDRQKTSKFFISKFDYKFNSYPDYTGGPWLMSGTIVPLLYETAITKSLPALPYEDVFITGVVAQKCGISRKQLPALVYFYQTLFSKLDYCWFKKTIIFWQNLDDFMLIKGWKQILSTRDMNCINNKSTVQDLENFLHLTRKSSLYL